MKYTATSKGARRSAIVYVLDGLTSVLYLHGYTQYSITELLYGTVHP